jgi:hypothetical protein
LSGAERDNTQHIRIRYRQSVGISPSISRVSKNSPQSVPQRPGHISLSHSNDSLARKLNQFHLSPTGSPSRSPRPLPHVENDIKSGQHLANSPDLHSTRSSCSVSSGESPSFSPRSLPAVNGIDTPRTRHLSGVISNAEMKDRDRKTGPTRSMSTPVFIEEMDKGKTSGSNTPLMLTPVSSPSRCHQTRLSVNDEYVTSPVTPSATKSASISSSSASDELYGVRAEGRSTSTEKRLSSLSHSASLDTLHQVASSPSIASKARLLSDNLLSRKGRGELHLYILSRESPFFMNLQAAVLNYNIGSRLSQFLVRSRKRQHPTHSNQISPVCWHKPFHITSVKKFPTVSSTETRTHQSLSF